MILRERHAGGSYATHLSLPLPTPHFLWLIRGEHHWCDNNGFVVVPLILKRACAKAQPRCDSQVPTDAERSCEIQSRHSGDPWAAASAYQHQGSDGGLQKVPSSCVSVSLALSVMNGAEVSGLGANCPGMWRAVVAQPCFIVGMWLCPTKPTHCKMPQPRCSTGNKLK